MPHPLSTVGSMSPAPFYTALCFGGWSVCFFPVFLADSPSAACPCRVCGRLHVITHAQCQGGSATQMQCSAQFVSLRAQGVPVQIRSPAEDRSFREAHARMPVPSVRPQKRPSSFSVARTLRHQARCSTEAPRVRFSRSIHRHPRISVGGHTDCLLRRVVNQNSSARVHNPKNLKDAAEDDRCAQ